jgi:hypothetical protein
MNYKYRKSRGKDADKKKLKLQKRLRTKIQIVYELQALVCNICSYPKISHSKFIDETVDRVLEITFE